MQGFPKEFNFSGIPLNSAYKQCGNTVCVPVIRRIAEQIKILFDGDTDEQNEKTILQPN
jgi:DNA (cytosine-5)-methyltransferase 1